MTRSAVSFISLLTVWGSFFLIMPVNSGYAAVLTVPDTFPSIESAIAAAANGDQIYIKAGLYKEELIVNKKLTFFGEISHDGQLLTILDGENEYSILTLNANGCIVRDLILQNGGEWIPQAGIDINSASNTIRNCIFRWCVYGININSTQYNRVERNVFFHNRFIDILMVTNTQNSSIRYNEFQSGPVGISMDKCKNNTISGNLFSVDSGLELVDSTGNRISANEFVCNVNGADDDTGGNNWIENGWSLYDDSGSPFPIPGIGGDEDTNSHIALSLNFRDYGLSATIVVPDDFPTIQEAVDNGGSGDRIFIRKGVYFENVRINKSGMIIFGELDAKGRLLTIVDADNSGYGFNVSAEKTFLLNLIIQNSGGIHDFGVILNSNGCVVSDCLIRDCGGSGVRLNADGCSIKYNVLYDMNEYCIDTCGCGITHHGASIGCNRIHDSGGSIHLEDVTGSYLAWNVVSTGYGIELGNSENVLLENNEMSCDDHNSSDNRGHLNTWIHNGFSDYDGFSAEYFIPGGAGSDKKPFISASFMH